MNEHATLPLLRPLDIFPVTDDDGETQFLVRDSAQIAPQPLLVSRAGYFVLAHLDGQHTLGDLQGAFKQYTNLDLPAEQVAALISALDDNLMIANARFAAAYDERVATFRAAETRDNRARYPSARDLREELQDVLKDSPTDIAGDVAGVIAPHLDYARGAPCYAAAYAALRASGPADRYVILGTNHAGSGRGVVATRKDFETPLGRVTTDGAFVDALEQRLNVALCEDEFDHDGEHSIELQVHLLQVLQGDRPFSIVPLLCPDPSVTYADDPEGARGPAWLGAAGEAVGAVARASSGRTVIIAGADLSHVGQRFGDEQVSTPAFLADIERRDRSLLELVAAGRADEFVAQVAREDNCTRICSVGSIYALLRALPDAECRVLQYHQAVDYDAETHVTCAAAALVRR